MIRWWHVPAMIALVAVLHFGAVWSGFYDWQFATKVFWFDNVLHGLVGVGFAMGALYLLEVLRVGLRPLPASVAVLVIVLTLAAVWELVEYVFFTRFTEYAYWSRIYSPSITEALADIVSDLVGGALLLTALWRRL